jgi:hypothetical protein
VCEDKVQNSRKFGTVNIGSPWISKACASSISVRSRSCAG